MIRIQLIARLLVAILAFAVGYSSALAQPPRVAVVHVGEVFDQYEKAVRLNKEAADADMAERAKIQKEHRAILWKEMHDAARTIATEHKIVVILGYSGPPDKADLDRFPNLNRTMQAMDGGSIVPLHRTGRADITQDVIDMLNKQPRQKPRQGSPAGTDRVALVNIGHAFTGYKEAIAFKKMMEQKIEPIKQAAQKHQTEIADCEAAIRRAEFEFISEEQLKTKIKLAKGHLQDLTAEAQRVFGKFQDDNLVRLWKNVQAGIQTHARRERHELILGYGDPLDKAQLDQFPNINRKIQALEAGCVIPFFASPRMDVAPEVTALLNDPTRAIYPAKPTEAVRVVHLNYMQVSDPNVLSQRGKGQYQRDNFVNDWMRIQSTTKRINSYGFDLVLAYAEPLDSGKQFDAANVSRKMQAIESGGLVPLYLAPGGDLSGAVTETMKRFSGGEK